MKPPLLTPFLDRSGQRHWLVGVAGTAPILTVELTYKWYSVYVIEPGGKIREVLDFIDWIDHVPNPKALRAYAARHDLQVHGRAAELIVGRWILEGHSKEDV